MIAPSLAAAACPRVGCTGSATPQLASASAFASKAFELSVKFRSDIDGYPQRVT